MAEAAGDQLRQLTDMPGITLIDIEDMARDYTKLLELLLKLYKPSFATGCNEFRPV